MDTDGNVLKAAGGVAGLAGAGKNGGENGKYL